VRKAGAGDEPPSALPKAANITNSTASTTYTLFDLNGNRLGTSNGFTVPAGYPKGTYIIRAEADGQPTISKKVAR
jgi:hypothetical protein